MLQNFFNFLHELCKRLWLTNKRENREEIHQTQEKQDKYTMDPGRQIYLSNNKKKFGQK